MLVAFTLSMPSNNSWNNKWSGEDRLYAKVLSVSNSKKTIEKYTELSSKYFSHNFGDGWCAAVDVKIVTAKEAREIRKRSNGFCGYDWMIESICIHGEIRV